MVPPRNVAVFVRGCRTASHFLLRGQKKVTKEKATLLRRPAGSLRSSPKRVAAQLATLKQCSPTAPALAAVLGGSEGVSVGG